MKIIRHTVFLLIISCCLLQAQPSKAAGSNTPICKADDKLCLLKTLEDTASGIENDSWRDKTYRETAKLLSREKETDWAISIIDKIINPDTKALTIRGIGMSASQTDMTDEEFDSLFIKLREKAEDIDHPPSYAIALTYIAMSQAFAGDDDGALKTASDMENDALRNKAFAESAEIQAERGELALALESIAQIDSDAYRNKAYRLIAQIFAKQKNYPDALNAAMEIDNDYQRSQAILFILSRQISPEEVMLVE